MFSGKILDLKEGKQDAIQYFYSLLKEEICENITICVVPSSDAEKTVTGMGLLAQKPAKNETADKVYFLHRTHSIDKLATGGNRDINIHLESISVVEDISIEGDIVLLMDDVTTSGNSSDWNRFNQNQIKNNINDWRVIHIG